MSKHYLKRRKLCTNIIKQVNEGLTNNQTLWQKHMFVKLAD
jgi:hypothetical protein